MTFKLNGLFSYTELSRMNARELSTVEDVVDDIVFASKQE